MYNIFKEAKGKKKGFNSYFVILYHFFNFFNFSVYSVDLMDFFVVNFLKFCPFTIKVETLKVPYRIFLTNASMSVYERNRKSTHHNIFCCCFFKICIESHLSWIV